MAVIKITNFGGILPGVSERALPPDNAVEAEALLASTPEFRPLLEAVEYEAALGTSAPYTIYRMARTSLGAPNTDPSTGWLAYANWTNLVRWPQNDNDTERTSVTDGAGGYAPRVIDNLGENRLLGVPAPGKPTATLNEGDYYTEQDRANDMMALKAGILASLQDALDRAKIGATYTGDLLPGYLEDGAEVAPSPSLIRYRVHRYDAEDGTIVDAYTATPEADVAWIRTTGLGQWMQADGTPAWMGAVGTWHYALPYHAYGAGYQFDSAGATTALDALSHLDAGQITEIVDRAEAMFDPAAPAAVAVIQPLQQAVTEFERAIEERPPGAPPTPDDLRASAIEACANQIYQALVRLAGTHTAG